LNIHENNIEQISNRKQQSRVNSQYPIEGAGNFKFQISNEAQRKKDN